MLRKVLKLLCIIPIIFIFTACEKKETGGIQKVHWDRDMCDRCKMVISERNHAAQVINPENHKTYKFDDIGCVPLWFKDENIQWKDNAKIWIADIKTSKWIDARTAFYDTMNVTPMAYGFGAHESKETIEKGQEIVNFEELSKRVLKIGR